MQGAVLELSERMDASRSIIMHYNIIIILYYRTRDRARSDELELSERADTSRGLIIYYNIIIIIYYNI